MRRRLLTIGWLIVSAASAGAQISVWHIGGGLGSVAFTLLAKLSMTLH